MNEKPADPNAMPIGYGELTFGGPKTLQIDSMEKAWRLATMVLRAKMAPQGLDTQEAICIALLHGAEVGLPPMMSLQRIAVLGGRPTIWGDAALAVVRSSGLLEGIKEWIDGEGDDRTAFCTVTRKGEEPQTSTFSVADAKRAGLWDERATARRRNKQTGEWFEGRNDAPWRLYPDRMLTMRARGYRLRDSFGDCLGGMYLREEFHGTTIEGTAIETPPGAAPTPPTPPTPPDPPAPPSSQGASEEIGSEILDKTSMGNTPVPPEPPAPPTKMDAQEADRFIAQYDERLKDAHTNSALDALWNEMVLPMIDADHLDDSVLSKLQELDDEQRGHIGSDYDVDRP